MPILNDGSYSYGTALLPITGLAGTLLGNYVAENLTVNYPTSKIEVLNQVNEPLGKIYISGFLGGTTTLQCGAAATPMVHNGATFGFNGHKFAISEVGDTRSQADIVKASVTFDKVYN